MDISEKAFTQRNKGTRLKLPSLSWTSRVAIPHQEFADEHPPKNCAGSFLIWYNPKLGFSMALCLNRIIQNIESMILSFNPSSFLLWEVLLLRSSGSTSPKKEEEILQKEMLIWIKVILVLKTNQIPQLVLFPLDYHHKRMTRCKYQRKQLPKWIQMLSRCHVKWVKGWTSMLEINLRWFTRNPGRPDFPLVPRTRGVDWTLSWKRRN